MVTTKSQKPMTSKPLPNILICGTPGTGKTSLCTSIITDFPTLTHIDLSSLVQKDSSLREEFDSASQAWILNDDAIVDYLEEHMKRGGVVLDTHSLIDYFPQRWFDLVVVLEANNTVLYDRLKRRGYAEPKIHENVQCEIMRVVRDEAVESYEEQIVQVLPSNSVEEMESNTERVIAWVQQFMKA